MSEQSVAQSATEGTSRILLFFDNTESRDFLGVLLEDTVLSCSSRELSDELLLIIVMLKCYLFMAKGKAPRAAGYGGNSLCTTAL